MRSYTDQEDSQTKGVNKHSLLNDNSGADDPAPKTEKTEQPKVMKTRKPMGQTRVAGALPKEEKPPVQPAARNSVELIEGSKRREVDMP
jgi:hypothetical protein